MSPSAATRLALTIALVLVPVVSQAADFTIEPLSPLTQSTPDLFGVNCFVFLLTNTGAEAESFHMDAENLTPPTWFGAVQVKGLVTYPYPAVHPLQYVRTGRWESDDAAPANALSYLAPYPP